MTKAQRAIQGPAAWLGLFAVLFQAILFGWHHHEPIWRGRLPAPIVENHAAAAQVLDDADSCDICQVLHHLTATPPAFAAAPARPSAEASTASPGPAILAGAAIHAFQARAPPLA